MHSLLFDQQIVAYVLVNEATDSFLFIMERGRMHMRRRVAIEWGWTAY